VRTVEGFGQPCEYVFSEDQPWPKTDRLNFIDETQDLVSIYDEDGASERTPIYSGSSTRQPSVPRIADLHSGSGTPTTPLTPRNGQPSPTKRQRLNHEQSPSVGYQPVDETFIHETAEDDVTPSNRQSISRSPYMQRLAPDSSELEFSSTNSPHRESQRNLQLPTVGTPQIYTDNPQWPLRDLEQAKLMRYYIENIAPFLDLCDLKRHFALVVPHRAASCPPLLNAIFAASARHLSRVAGADAWVADNYHSECLKSLIPLLNDSAALTDENLLAAMIILRYHEEIECEKQRNSLLLAISADQDSSTLWHGSSKSPPRHAHFHGGSGTICGVRRTTPSSILGRSADGTLLCIPEFEIHSSKS
jgi:hypothetical protein